MHAHTFLCCHYIPLLGYSYTHAVPETSIHNLTFAAFNSTSISLVWDIRDADKLYGSSRLFVIMYHPTDEGNVSIKGANTSNMVSLKDLLYIIIQYAISLPLNIIFPSFLQSYTLNGLAPYTVYTIIVSVYNGYRTGPAETMLKRTAEAGE